MLIGLRHLYKNKIANGRGNPLDLPYWDNALNSDHLIPNTLNTPTQNIYVYLVIRQIT